ncbi:hypothetical protein [Bordetella genomosp. 5]|uniref:hypothetical protein n=1 Tax=Bordetella genomosp. 5 TaxID=1395608 RepID=UPI0014822659|nr:hypothetical protein [Bordetella genomosp. 5]
MSSFIEGLVRAELSLLGVSAPPADADASREAAEPAREVRFDAADYRSAAG